jgi:hypothetical protein
MPPIKTFTAIVIAFVLGLMMIATRRHVSAQSQDTRQTKQKNLKEIAEERDVEVEGFDGFHLVKPTLEDLREASAIVYGRIIDNKSFFDESSPDEYGESITTEYTVDVLRIFKDMILRATPAQGKAMAQPLSTPLKIARNGGEVEVNGHRASIRVKGYESLKPGKEYIFFLVWSPDYKAYSLAYGISGAVMVNDDSSLNPLSQSKEIQAKLRGLDLESFIDLIKQWQP